MGAMVGLLVGAMLLASCGMTGGRTKPLPTPTVIPLPPLDPARVAQGRQLYLQHCASCHGEGAQGAPNWQVPNARGDLPAPPHDDSGHTWRHRDSELTGIILNGMRDPFNKTPELTMPPFSGIVTHSEVEAMITYFKSLWSPDRRRYQEEQNLKPMMATPAGSGQ
jgi:mono/diheme cytochrome c family protein